MLHYSASQLALLTRIFQQLSRFSSLVTCRLSFILQEATLWMASNWKISFTYSAIYLIVIFGGRRYMKDRPRLEIRPVLSAWNFMLAAFRLVNSLHSDLVLMVQLAKPSDNLKNWFLSMILHDHSFKISLKRGMQLNSIT